jgi:hypothetical protein
VSLVVGSGGLNPDWPPTSMRSFPARGTARVLVIEPTKLSETLDSSRGCGRCR